MRMTCSPSWLFAVNYPYGVVQVSFHFKLEFSPTSDERMMRLRFFDDPAYLVQV